MAVLVGVEGRRLKSQPCKGCSHDIMVWGGGAEVADAAMAGKQP